MTEAKRCIYCRETKPLAEFSEEHIIPRFMGGASACAAAVTDDACVRCNGLFGRFVDAAVAKGFFLNAQESGAWRACFDYDRINGNVFPLVYFGKCTEIQCVDGEEAEVWLCPEGGTAWHVHEARGEDFATFAGGDPYLRRKDESSRAYVFQASTVPYWLLSNLKSAVAHFKEEPIFIGANSDIEAQLTTERIKGRLCRKDTVAIAERDQIRTLLDRGSQIKHALKLDTLFDVRFLAKIAIAFGHKLFGEEYASLSYTDMLRTFLWTRRTNLKPEDHQIKMFSYFAGLENYAMKPVSFPLGFVFIFKYVEGDAVLAVIFPSGHQVQVSITDKTVDPEFSVKDRFTGEHVLVSVPQLGQTFGPVGFSEYLSWTLGSNPIPELDHVKARITPRSSLPPLR